MDYKILKGLILKNLKLDWNCSNKLIQMLLANKGYSGTFEHSSKFSDPELKSIAILENRIPIQLIGDQELLKMPDERSAIRQLNEAVTRLKELGWNNAIYCPKDGSMFSVIEAESTSIHECNYQGEWPKGSWWIYDGDMWPSRPILWRPRKETDPNVNLGLSMNYDCAHGEKANG